MPIITNLRASDLSIPQKGGRTVRIASGASVKVASVTAEIHAAARAGYVSIEDGRRSNGGARVRGRKASESETEETNE